MAGLSGGRRPAGPLGLRHRAADPSAALRVAEDPRGGPVRGTRRGER